MISSNRRIARQFNNDAPLFHGRDTTIEGRAVKVGDPVATHLAHGTRLRLWLMSHIHTADQMSRLLRTEFNADPVVVAREGGGWWSISAPWLDEPIKVKGEKNAEAEGAALREAGEPDYHHNVGVSGDSEGDDIDDGLRDADEQPATPPAEEAPAKPARKAKAK